jgi:hypothetical protein
MNAAGRSRSDCAITFHFEACVVDNLTATSYGRAISAPGVHGSSRLAIPSRMALGLLLT